ncbi:hypothetical protein ACQP10_24900 [Streptosporangium sandarakinum]|uniref:hypothetical protein n=1 Tax=Streptosporangium sandarakinum TaxID=1260955 RepID=UPI003D8A43F2
MPRFIAILIIAASIIAGCSEGEVLDKPTITEVEALARVEHLIKGAAAAIKPEPKLDLYRPSLNSNGCPDSAGGDSGNRMMVSRSYYLRGIPQERLAEAAMQVKHYWERQGHYIEGASANGLNISGRSRPDGFLLSLDATDSDNGVVLGIGATSPCVWRNGTPEPSSTG